jgi:hypothetical protein
MTRHLLCCTALALAAGLAQAQTAIKPPAAKAKAKLAAAVNKPAPAEEESEGVRAVREIFACLAAGLPEAWQRAWVVVTELAGDDKERSFEGKFHYSLDPDGVRGVPLVPCDAREAAARVYALNEFLEPEQRRWKVATLVFTRDGKFELKYDYDQ